MYHITGINPEPWEASRTAPGRKGGKMFVQHYSPEQMKAFQAAVKEELILQNGHLGMFPDGTFLTVTFFLWRRQEVAEMMEGRTTRATELEAARRQQRAAWVDTTNCQKSLEDALQGLVYKNDKYNRDVRCVVMDQGPDVTPHITIVIKTFEVPDCPSRPTYNTKTNRGNTWPPSELTDEEPF